MLLKITPLFRLIHAFLNRPQHPQQSGDVDFNEIIRKSILSLLSCKAWNLNVHSDKPIVTAGGRNQWDDVVDWYYNEVEFLRGKDFLKFSLEDIELMNKSPFWLLHRVIYNLKFEVFPKISKSDADGPPEINPPVATKSRRLPLGRQDSQGIVDVGEFENMKVEAEKQQERAKIAKEREEILVEIYSNFSVKFLLSPFSARHTPKAESIEDGPHLLNNILFFNCNEKKKIIYSFMKLGKASDAFLRAFLHQSLLLSETYHLILREFLDILGWLLFHDIDPDQQYRLIFAHDIKISLLSKLKNISSSIINELVGRFEKNHFLGLDLELVFSLLTFPFRIESLEARQPSFSNELTSLQTPTMWIKSHEGLPALNLV